MQRSRGVAHPFLDRSAHALLVVLEVIVMVLLGILVLLAIAAVVEQLFAAMSPPFLTGEPLTAALEDVLSVFVLIELLATAAAYLRGTDVMRRLFETIFIAIARKLITLEFSRSSVDAALAVAALLVAAGVAWWLVARAPPRTDVSE